MLEVINDQQYINEDFSDIDLSQRELRGIRFINCSFKGATFEDTESFGCDFSECDFRAAKLNASIHHNTAFTNCNFRFTSLFGAQFDECKMLGSGFAETNIIGCLLYTSPSPRDRQKSRMPSSA
jgi:uncharacterized protein YjbI with pentapeptide repeats